LINVPSLGKVMTGLWIFTDRGNNDTRRMPADEGKAFDGARRDTRDED